MEQLPVELLDMIFEHADFSAVKNVRLTCKALAKPAAAHLFHDLHLLLSLEHLHKLEKIANHPELRDLVKCFTFHGELLPALDMREAWERLIDLRPSRSMLLDIREREERALKGRQLSPDELSEIRRIVNDEREALLRHTKSPEELDLHFKQYQVLYNEQSNWSDDREGEQFRQAFRQLRNLTRAEVVENYQSSNKRTPGWFALVPRILLGPDNWWRLRASSTENRQMRRQLTSIQHLSCLLESVVLKNKTHPKSPVTNMTIVTGGDAFWCQRHRLLPDMEASNSLNLHVEAMKFAFSHLTHLRFKVWFMEHDFTDALTAGLALFLREARLLEYLSLEFVEEKLVGVEENDQLCDMLVYLEDVTWPRLRELALTLTSTEEAFLRLLERHSNTLKVLRLLDSSLRVAGGAWVNILLKIPSILKLEKVYLEALIDGTIEIGKPCLFEINENGAYEKAFEDYLLGRGEFPILDRDEFYRNHNATRDDWRWESPGLTDGVTELNNLSSSVHTDGNVTEQAGVLEHYAPEASESDLAHGS